MKSEVSIPRSTPSFYQRFIQGFSCCVAVGSEIVALSHLRIGIAALPELQECYDCGPRSVTTGHIIRDILPTALIILTIEIVVLLIVWRSYLLRVWGCVATCALSYVTMLIFLCNLPTCD